MITSRSTLISVLTSKGFEPASLSEMTLEPFVDMVSYRHGLTFVIPRDYADYVFRTPKGGLAILVDSPNDGWRVFSLRTFIKRVWAYNKDGEPLGCFKCASGTAIERFNMHTTVKEALDSLAGKLLCVSKVEEYYRQGLNGLERCTIPVIDIKQSLTKLEHDK